MKTTHFLGSIRVVDEKTHDVVYFRPFNFRADSAERRSHSVEYASHPDWGWERLGYGSSGTGGKLCVGLRKSFGLRKKEGNIKDFHFRRGLFHFQRHGAGSLEAVPELRGDPNLGAINEGVTIVWLK